MNIENPAAAAIHQLNLELEPYKASLVAVSKFQPGGNVAAAYQGGQRLFGENYVQELLDKKSTLPDDIQWHFIGHLQRNKIKFLAPFVKLIHGVDSLKLLRAIDTEARKAEQRIQVLLQVFIATEETKFGMSVAELDEVLLSLSKAPLNMVHIKGMMAMATNTDNTTQIEREFKSMYLCYQTYQEKFAQANHIFDTLSMGMTSDYKIALAQGSNMVRIGSKIFGNRNR